MRLWDLEKDMARALSGPASGSLERACARREVDASDDEGDDAGADGHRQKLTGTLLHCVRVLMAWISKNV